MKRKIAFIVIALIIVIVGVWILVSNNRKEDYKKNYSYEELSNMALEYFFATGDIIEDKEEYHVGIDKNVIPKYQNQNMVVIEIRHINANVINTLDARYYINIYTAKGYDDLENDIDLKQYKN